MENKKTKKTETQDEFVQVKKEDLQNLFKRLDTLSKNQELLFEAADKNRLSKAQNKSGEPLIHTVKISKWDDTDKYVVGWKLIKNRCEVINGVMVTEQNTQVVLNDGTVLESVPLLEFYRKIIKKDTGEIISKENKYESNGNLEEIYKIQLSNGMELLINSKFVN